MKINPKKSHSCQSCGCKEAIIDKNRGEMICKRCGLVLEESIFDAGPEWRAFDDEQTQNRARSGGPVKYAKQNKGLVTEIDRYDRDSGGGSIPAERKAQIYRLRKWQRRSRMGSSMQRNLSIALPELDRMATNLNLASNLKEECARIYRKCVVKGIVRGRSIESVVAAIIYLVSRNRRSPRTLKELETVSGVSSKEIGRSYRSICRRLNIEMPVVKPSDYIPRLASELGVSGKTEIMATKLIRRIRKKGFIAGKVPIAMAAGALYIVGRLNKEEGTKDFKPVAHLSKSAVRNRYREIAHYLKKSNVKSKKEIKQKLAQPS